MAGKKDPSIYDDRSTIGSSDELDEYGVWVKSEPQDLSSSLSDLPDIDELPDITGLGTDDSELPDFSDFSSPEPDNSIFSASETDDFDLSDDPLSLSDDELNLPEEINLPDDSLDIPEIDLSDDIFSDSDSSTENASPAKVSPSAPPPGAAPSAAASSDLPDDDDDDDFPDGGFLGPLGGPDLEFEELPDDIGLPESPSPSGKSGGGDSSGGSYDEVSMDDFLDSGSTPKKIEIGNLDEVLDSPKPASKAQAPGNGGGADLSNQLLMKIADELSSIKKEIASLKTELSVVRGEVKSEAQDAKAGGFFDEEDDEKIALTGDELDNILHTTEEATEEATAEATVEDDDDEKIALTGDELDNILHTADFIEEAGSDEGLNDDLSFDEGTLDDGTQETGFLSNQEDLISESPEATTEDASETAEDTVDISFEDSDLGASLDLDSDLPDFSDETPELNELREMGIKPVTFPPDDTSYLEADPLAASPIDHEDQIDFSGAVIDEPDLSSQLIENPVLEPAIENISIDVDMEEPILTESSGSDDFVFEVEETMEIPVKDTSADAFSMDDISMDDISMDDSSTDEISFDEGESSDSSGFSAPGTSFDDEGGEIPSNLKNELKTVLTYMDQLLESLPEEKIEEFARSEYFETYKKLFEELGLA